MRMALAFCLLLLGGCGGNSLKDFETSNQPTLDLYDYFQGRSLAYGVFVDRFGTLRRQFKVVVDGRIDADVLILDEDFYYADGERDRRVWRIRRTGPGRYEGRSDKVVGVADGRAAGNALNWKYKFDLPVGEDTWRVGFDDWLFLQEDGVLINRAVVRRWGFVIGTVTITFVRDPLPVGEEQAVFQSLASGCRGAKPRIVWPCAGPDTPDA